MAATEIGLPRIDPELSIKIVTNVSLNSVCFSLLKDKELNGSIITLVNFDVSSIPSSRSNSQDLFCFANNFLCSLFANLETKFFNCKSCWSKVLLSLSNSSSFSKSSALLNSSNSFVKTLYFFSFLENIFLNFLFEIPLSSSTSSNFSSSLFFSLKFSVSGRSAAIVIFCSLLFLSDLPSFFSCFSLLSISSNLSLLDISSLLSFSSLISILVIILATV